MKSIDRKTVDGYYSWEAQRGSSFSLAKGGVLMPFHWRAVVVFMAHDPDQRGADVPLKTVYDVRCLNEPLAKRPAAKKCAAYQSYLDRTGVRWECRNESVMAP